MKISDFKNEKALDVLADIIDPVFEICNDPEIRDLYRSDGTVVAITKLILKNHQKSALEILARLDEKTIDEYECNVVTLPLKIIELLNDEILLDFFVSQGQMMEGESFGSVTENTKVEKK